MKVNESVAVAASRIQEKHERDKREVLAMIKTTMDSKGLLIRHVMQQAGLRPSTWSNWMGGEKKPRDRHLSLVAKVVAEAKLPMKLIRKLRKDGVNVQQISRRVGFRCDVIRDALDADK